MRHRDKKSAWEALSDWKALRQKVTDAGGENYDAPVLVQFTDTKTFEVMDREIVEDEFYVLRKYKLVRELAADGADLEKAISEQKRPPGSGSGGRNRGRSGRGRRRSSRSSGRDDKRDSGGDGSSKKPSRRRRPRRTGKPKEGANAGSSGTSSGSDEKKPPRKR
ncbi:MAG: hypothetical protein ACYTDT_12505, partial [Planctomycetota bacterium]